MFRFNGTTKELMSKTDTPLLRIFLDSYGLTPVSEWLEARSTKDGYCIVGYNSYGLPEPKELYRSHNPYSWRDVAVQLPTIFDPMFENVEEEAAQYLDIEGEIGLPSEIIRYAYACGDGRMPEFAHLLIQQSDQTLKDIEKQVGGELDEEGRVPIEELAYLISDLGLEPDLIGLSALYITGGKLNIPELIDELNKLEVVEKKLRSIRLKPYQDEVEQILSEFSDLRPPPGFPSQKVFIREFLNRFILEHGHLPRGTHRIVSKPGASFRYDLGEHDFR